MSPTEAKAPDGFVYVLTLPVTLSVTATVYSTFDRAPKKTQNRPLTERASRTLITSSTLAGEKNQK